jgi:hypothetical protein
VRYSIRLTATLFDPPDDRSFALLLPLSPSEALLEFASFRPAGMKEDRAPLLRYLGRNPPGADFRLPLALLQRVMGAVPLAQSLRFIDEDLPPRQLLPLVRTALPVVLGKKR